MPPCDSFQSSPEVLLCYTSFPVVFRTGREELNKAFAVKCEWTERQNFARFPLFQQNSLLVISMVRLHTVFSQHSSVKK